MLTNTTYYIENCALSILNKPNYKKAQQDLIGKLISLYINKEFNTELEAKPYSTMISKLFVKSNNNLV